MPHGVSYTRLSRWYQQLAQSLDAGIPLAEALTSASGPPRKDIEQMAQALRSGAPVDHVLENSGKWLSLADRYLLSAASQSGRLGETCNQLAIQHRTFAENQGQVITACIYPVAILHFAVFALPLPVVVTFTDTGSPIINFALYIELLVLCVGLFWGGLFLLARLIRAFPRATKRILRFLPGLRRYAKSMSLARFADSLEALLSAGVNMHDAFGGAALIADDPKLTPQLLTILPHIQQGQAPSTYLSQLTAIPVDFSALYRTGEKTGKLDQNLHQLAYQYRDDASKGLRSAAFWYPKLVFLALSFLISSLLMAAMSRYLDFVLSLAE